MPAAKAKVAFIEPMLLLRKESLPEGPEWLIELKLDGYRALAIRTGGKVQLRSRNDNDFSARYPGIVKALAAMATPSSTVKLWPLMKKANPPSIRCRTTAPPPRPSIFSFSIC
jgi:hypothetical protein